ncbi:PREDICTED: centrosomal protein of 128 kDa [Propithecus coquereli]|uniref:centrosomal protein of 128 kDa n=1 Tax=Propithecus coquereli TaxID=379532 RepID=UPI00063EF53C|nr:PREDICTED: centrosomal protein of 128 kDa [Propithecus coquereli]
MAESSSESDHFCYRDRLSRWAARSTHREIGSHPTVEVTEKVNTITSSLQDTSRNLRQVDQMLGRYREYNKGQAGAIEHIILSALRIRLVSVLWNFMATARRLENSLDSHRFPPTSPLKDYGDPQGVKRIRSRSGIQFVREPADMVQLHAFHQSLRDLSSEQVRLGDDFNRELSRRSRSDAETKRVLEELTEKLNEAQKKEVVSDRVEQRLQEIEREMRTERELVERRQDQLGLMSLQLQELEQELELSRRLLNESEGSRETLLFQVEELRTQLTKAEGDRKGFQQVFQISKQQSNHEAEQGVDWRFRRGIEREKQDLEKQMSDLRVQLNFNAMASELEELKRCMERKDKEKAHLAAQVENLTRELEKREKQQLQMLDQLKEIQNHFDTHEAERKHADLQISELTHHAEDATKQAEQYLSELQQSEALREEAEKRREDLKQKAQESIRQWKLKHKKLERALEKQSETLEQLSDKNNQILKEKDEMKSQLYATLQQTENLRKELNDVLTKRALQEEELHLKEEKLSDIKCCQADLELEVKNSVETIQRLESELKKQSKIQSQMKTEKVHLEEEIVELKKSQAKDKAKLLELQESIKDLSAIRADLANKLAEEERAKKAVLKELSDLTSQVKSRDEETATVITQLKLERDVHQRELKDLTSSLQSVKTKHEQNIQELMKHFKKEKSEAENHIRTLKAESLEEKNMAKAHRCQMERLKSQCDRLTEELTQNESENKKLKLKYQCLKDQLEEKEKYISNEEEHLRRTEEARLQLKDQLLCLETEQESILVVIGKEIDAACKTFSGDSMEKLKVIMSSHRWQFKVKTKLQWLCEELKERESREKNLRHQLTLSRQQLRDLTENKEAELQCLFQQIERQEQLLEEIHQEKRDLLEETQRKDEEMGSLQERVIALETSTRVALDHLESVPEKLSLLEDFKDFRDTRSSSERIDGRYSKYRVHRDSLQHQQDDTKYRNKSFKDDKTSTGGSYTRELDLSSSWQDHSRFLSSPRFSHLNSFSKRTVAPDSASIKEDATSLPMNGTSPQSKNEEYES